MQLGLCAAAGRRRICALSPCPVLLYAPKHPRPELTEPAAKRSRMDASEASALPRIRLEPTAAASAEFRPIDLCAGMEYWFGRVAPKDSKGRPIEANFTLMTSKKISKQHAQITLRPEDNAVVLTDRSTNGTFVNGDRVKTEHVILSHNDEITFATVVTDGMPAYRLVHINASGDGSDCRSDNGQCVLGDAAGSVDGSRGEPSAAAYPPASTAAVSQPVSATQSSFAAAPAPSASAEPPSVDVDVCSRPSPAGVHQSKFAVAAAAAGWSPAPVPSTSHVAGLPFNYSVMLCDDEPPSPVLSVGYVDLTTDSPAALRCSKRTLAEDSSRRVRGTQSIVATSGEHGIPIDSSGGRAGLAAGGMSRSGGCVGGAKPALRVPQGSSAGSASGGEWVIKRRNRAPNEGR